MDRSQRSSHIAANAVMSIACPWCDESLRVTVAELRAGISCPSCLVTVDWAETPVSLERPFVEPIAA